MSIPGSLVDLPPVREPLRAVLINFHAPPADLRERLTGRGFQVGMFRELRTWLGETPTAPASLILVQEHWPGEHSRGDVSRLIARHPTAHILCLGSPWSESYGRSGAAWPAALVVRHADADARVDAAIRAAYERRPPTPPTAGRDELAELRIGDRPPDTVPGQAPLQFGRVRVASAEPVFRAFLIEAAAQLGASPAPVNVGLINGFKEPDTASAGDECDTLLWDGDPWTARSAALWRDARQRWPNARRLVLTGLVAPEDHPASAPGTVVISKLAPVSRWKRLLQCGGLLGCLLGLLLTGCSPPPRELAPRPGGPAATPHDEQKSFARQLDDVQTGRSTAIRCSTARISKSDWRRLRTGCEALVVLEVDAEPLEPDDLELAGALPRLRRLKLGAPIDDAGADRLARWPALAELNLPEADLTDAGLQALLSRPLRQLRLRSPRLTDAASGRLADCETLRFLHLIDVPWTDAVVPELSRMSALESLYLDGARCSDEGLSRLLTALPDLHFHRNQTHLADDQRADGH